MRSRILIATIAVAAVFAFGSTANALYIAHMDNNTVADSGDCSACHIPHKAPATKRGFPLAPASGSVTTYGYIGAFCLEKCHLVSTSATTGDGGNITWANTSATVAAASFGGGASGAAAGSHGMNLAATPHPPSATTVVATLPYGDGTANRAFECTTCHNVHANATGDASNSLLMLDIDALCDACHGSRGQGDTAWGATVYGTANTIGSHPVGTDVNNDQGGGGSPIRVGGSTAYGSTEFDLEYGVETEHNLGGHLINGAIGVDNNSPITCVTCHAVHGREADAGDADPTGGTTGTEDLLVVAQGVAGATEPNRHANGAGDANNALCEGCHVTDNAGTFVLGWNPGGTAFSHPADAMTDADAWQAGIQAVPDFGDIAATTLSGSTAEWPFGSVTAVGSIGMGANGAAGTQARVICESCHTPHPAANAGLTGYTSVPASGTAILRRDGTTLCGICHSGSSARHHPVGAGLMDGTLFDDDVISATTTADADLTCTDCHNGLSGMAHNWTMPNFPALDSDWEPANNGRTADANGARYQANTSKECFDCHFAGATPGRLSPTRNTANDGTQVDNNVNYEDWGVGSHFLGTIASGFSWATGFYNNATFNAETTVWPVAGGGSGSWSRFGGTAAPGILVCESCHDLEPDRNVADTPLLLGYYYEGNTVATGRSPERFASEFCEGCHGQTPGGNVTHPMTLNTVTKASDGSWTPVTLITSGTRSKTGTTETPGSYANASGQPGDTNYPATNAMNCDTCHQVHDAGTNSGTYILDAANAKFSSASPRGTALDLYGTGDYTRSTVTDVNYEQFCYMCHAY